MDQLTETRIARSVDGLYRKLHGHIRDTDSHEMYPARTWVAEYGEVAAPLATLFLKSQSAKVPNSFSVEIDEDVLPVSTENVARSWGSGCNAVGAFDMKRRLDVMDMMGVRDCLLFGSVMAIYGHQMATTGGELLAQQYANQDGGSAPDAMVLGRSVLRAHNDWCIRTAAISPRLRPVATILTNDLADAISDCEHLIGNGVRAIALPVGTTIGGKAPAHPDNDALWRLFASTGTALLFHVGGDVAFRRETTQWTDAPLFASNNSVPTEIPIDPFSMATSNLAVQNYVTNLVLGAVFERVPDLRCGIMEYCGYWIGPLAENLDGWADQFQTRFSGALSMKPSDYIRRNIRVAPFDFEPVDRYLDRFPFLEDVYCFATDYPHYEGGQDPITKMMDRLERFGPELVEKIFVRNAEWIMPD